MTESKDWHADPITRDSNDSSQPTLGATPWQPAPFRPSEGNIAIPRAVLEKIYLSPPTNVTGDFRNKMANPTPLGLVGFLVATLPTSFALMGLAGAGGGGVASSGLSMWFGGVLQLIACSMEYFLGNTFSFLVFGTFGKCSLRSEWAAQVADLGLCRGCMVCAFRSPSSRGDVRESGDGRRDVPGSCDGAVPG